MAVARDTRVTVALDSTFAARQLSDAARAAQVEIGVLAEVDVGLGRVGVSPGEQLLQLAQCIEKLPHLRLEGITFYPGQIKSLDEAGQRAIAQLSDLLSGILADFRAAGIEINIVSGGSTPTLFHSHEIQGLTEIRPGTYVFNDINTITSGGCAMEDCAASPCHRGLHRPPRTDDHRRRLQDVLVGPPGEPRRSDIRPTGGGSRRALSQDERGARLHRSGPCRAEFHVGDRVRVIPNHICVAVNLHEKIYGVRGDQVEEMWPVDARGKLQ